MDRGLNPYPEVMFWLQEVFRFNVIKGESGMKKDVTHRIAFYTRKVTERMAHHPSEVLPAKFIHRQERLMQYKKLMHQLIAKEGYIK
jgi:hypothetical protein